MPKSSKRKPSDALYELGKALTRFSTCSRYQMLQSVSIGKMLYESASFGALDEFTFEQLVHLGSAKLAKLKWMPPPELRRLTSFLLTLAGDQPAVSTQIIEDSSQIESVISGAESESRVRDLLKKIVDQPHFQDVAKRQLGDFWPPATERAPFEEAFTLAQLSKFDLNLLLRKKTMTPRKISLIADALTGVWQRLTEGVAEKSTRSLRLTSLPMNQKKDSVEQPPGSYLSPHTEILIDYCESFVERFKDNSAPLFALTKGLLTTLNRDQVAHFLQFIKEPIHSEAVEEAEPPYFDSLRDLFERCPQTKLLRDLLAGPGVSLTVLATLLSTDSEHLLLARLIALSITRLYHGTPLKVAHSIVSDYWTTSPAVVETLVRKILASDSADENELRKEIAYYLGGLPEDQIVFALRHTSC